MSGSRVACFWLPIRTRPFPARLPSPLEWRFSGLCAESLRVQRPGGFVVTWLAAAVRGCGCRSRAARLATPGRCPGRRGRARPSRSGHRTQFQVWKDVPVLSTSYPKSYLPPPSSTACPSALATPRHSGRHRPAEEIAVNREAVSFLAHGFEGGSPTRRAGCQMACGLHIVRPVLYVFPSRHAASSR